MGALSRLPLLLQAAAALNVSVVPSYFRSQKERKFFRTYGKWQTEERRCDKFIRNRAYDKTCQQMDPKPYELLRAGTSLTAQPCRRPGIGGIRIRWASHLDP